jgi:hypothetical protein
MSFGNDTPVVVDSPLPVEVDRFSGAPIETAGVPAVPAADATQQAATETPAAGQPNELVELSQKFGVDLTGFSSKQDALAAVRLQAERFAQAGIQPSFDFGPVSQGQQQVVPAQPAAEVEPNFDFGEDVNPKVVAFLKEQHKQTQAAIKEAKEARSQVDNFHRQSVTQRQVEVTQRAERSIDSLVSPKYGVSGKRNISQELAVQTLKQKAGAILNGFVYSNQPVPTIETIMALAVELDGGAGVVAQQQAAVGQQQIPAHSLSPRQGTVPNGGAPTLPNVARPHDPLGLLNDPGYIAGVKRIMASSK